MEEGDSVFGVNNDHCLGKHYGDPQLWARQEVFKMISFQLRGLMKSFFHHKLPILANIYVDIVIDKTSHRRHQQQTYPQAQLPMPDKKDQGILPLCHKHGHKPGTSEQEASESSSSTPKSTGKHNPHHKTLTPAEAGSSHDMETRSNDSMKGSSQGYYGAHSQASSVSVGGDYVKVKTTPSPTSSDSYVEVKHPKVVEQENLMDNAKIDELDEEFAPSLPKMEGGESRKKEKKKKEKK